MRHSAKEASPAQQGGNEIVVYQTDDELRIDVRVEDKTVWLNQSQLSVLFGVTIPTVNYHIREILNCGELAAAATIRKILIVRSEGARTVRRPVDFYNLDMIISVGYRVNSKRGVQFRQWATRVLTEHLLRGYTVNSRLNQLEDRTDRRLLEHDRRIETLESKVDFFVKTQTPPLQGVFYDGQLWDAWAFATRLVKRAKRSILLIDNWVDAETLDILAKKGTGVSVEIVTSKRGNKIAVTDIAKFTAQYGLLTVRLSRNFHDRFLILDDRELYLIGASLKDLGLKCFGFTKMDAKEIPVLKGRI